MLKYAWFSKTVKHINRHWTVASRNEVTEKWSTGNNVLMDSTSKSIDYLAIEWFNRIYVGCLSKTFNIAQRLEIYFLIGGKIAATT